MVLPFPAGVSEGCSVLLVSPQSATAVDERCLQLLSGDGPGRRGVVAVTIEHSASALIDGWIEHAGPPPTDLRVVDVGTGVRSVGTEPEHPSRSRNVIRSVEDPGDLAAIRATVRDLVAEPGPTEETEVVYLDSLAPVLEAAGRRATFRLVDDLGRLAKESRAVTVVRVDREARSRHTVAVLSGLVDVVLDRELSRGDGRWTVTSGRPSVDAERLLDPDDLFDVLSARPRRLALCHLLETDGPTAAVELAAAVADLDGSADELAETAAFQRTYAGLVHVHLPKLEAHGLVSVDADGGSIRLRRSPERLERLLAITARDDLRA